MLILQCIYVRQQRAGRVLKRFVRYYHQNSSRRFWRAFSLDTDGRLPRSPAALHDLIPRPQLPPRFCHAEGHTCIAYLGRYESVQCDLPDSDSPSHCSSLVTCGADNTVRLFSGYDDEDATTIDKHNAEVTSLTVSLNHFATGSADHQVQVVTHRATLACMFSLRLGFY